MNKLNCNKCGTPLKVRPRDIRKGIAICQHCDAVFKFEIPKQVSQKQTKQSLWLINKIKDIIGVQDDDLDTPVKKPVDSRIIIDNHPGYQFQATIDSAGFGFGSCFMAFFTFFWCGFLIIWNIIAIFQEAWIMVAFGLIHDLVGFFLIANLLWTTTGREELVAENETFTRKKILLGFSTTKNYPLSEIDDILFTSSRNSYNNHNKKLYLMVGTKKRRIASTAPFPDLKWLRQELLAFFKPRW